MLKFTKHLACASVLASAATAGATAFDVTVNDLTDTLSVTGNGTSGGTINISGETATSPAGGFASSLNFGPFNNAGVLNQTFNYNIYEDAAQTILSDTWTFHIQNLVAGGNTILRVNNFAFISEDDLGTPLTPLVGATSITENGTFQPVLSFANDAGTNTFVFQFQSDVEPVPEPTSLALAFLGGVGMLGVRKRRA